MVGEECRYGKGRQITFFLYTPSENAICLIFDLFVVWPPLNFTRILQGNIFSLHSGAGLFAIKLEFRKEGDLNSSPDLLIFCRVKILPVITGFSFFFSLAWVQARPQTCTLSLLRQIPLLRIGCAVTFPCQLDISGRGHCVLSTATGNAAVCLWLWVQQWI